MPPRRSWTYLRSSSFSASFAPAAELGWISIRHEDSFRVSHTTNSNIPTPRKWGTTKVSGKPGAIQVSPRPMPQRSSVRPASRRSATRSLLRATHPPPAEPTRRPQPQPSNPHHRHRPHPTLPQNPGLHHKTHQPRKNHPRSPPLPQTLILVGVPWPGVGLTQPQTGLCALDPIGTSPATSTASSKTHPTAEPPPKPLRNQPPTTHHPPPKDSIWRS